MNSHNSERSESDVAHSTALSFEVTVKVT